MAPVPVVLAVVLPTPPPPEPALDALDALDATLLDDAPPLPRPPSAAHAGSGFGMCTQPTAGTHESMVQ
jgi:hypothetical protein